MASPIGSVVKLVVFEALAIAMARYVILQIFGYDVFDFQKTVNKAIAVALTVYIFYTIYSTVSDPRELSRLGATVLYDPGDRMRIQSQVRPSRATAAFI